MKFIFQVDLKNKEHSKNTRLEASKWLHFLSRHLNENIDDKEFEEMIDISQPVCTRKGKKIGSYYIEKIMTDAEVTKELNDWSRRAFGYIDEEGNHQYGE